MRGDLWSLCGQSTAIKAPTKLESEDSVAHAAAPSIGLGGDSLHSEKRLRLERCRAV